ncbi:hypothetical protein [Mesobacillus sp.]|uniref:hypothetical protein n=1 Tax=Mesobacillus sp. TaxID=2675271 RepID=UPI0039F13AD3
MLSYTNFACNIVGWKEASLLILLKCVVEVRDSTENWRVNWLVFRFIGGFHNFIGDNSDLLAKKIFYWRKSDFIGDFHYFIGETESGPRFVSMMVAGSLLSTIKNTLRRPGGC